jgi:hypothetical protein
MKLKTRIDGTVGDYFLVLNGDSDMYGEDQLEHDAAAAHALMEAIYRYWNPKATQWIEDRADEIMRELGFDTGEEE